MKADLTITGGRVQLMPWTEADAEDFHRIWGDPEVIFWGANRDLAASRASIRRIIARCAPWPWPIRWFKVLDRDDGRLIGDVALQPSQSGPQNAIEAAWHLLKAEQGQGYASQSASLLISTAFARNPELPRVLAPILPDNVASKRVAARIGMKPIGHIFHANLKHELWEIRRTQTR